MKQELHAHPLRFSHLGESILGPESCTRKLACSPAIPGLAAKPHRQWQLGVNRTKPPVRRKEKAHYYNSKCNPKLRIYSPLQNYILLSFEIFLKIYICGWFCLFVCILVCFRYLFYLYMSILCECLHRSPGMDGCGPPCGC